MDLLSYWKAVTSKNSAENVLLVLRLFIQSFTNVLVGKSPRGGHSTFFQVGVCGHRILNIN